MNESDGYSLVYTQKKNTTHKLCYLPCKIENITFCGLKGIKENVSSRYNFFSQRQNIYIYIIYLFFLNFLFLNGQ